MPTGPKYSIVIIPQKFYWRSSQYHLFHHFTALNVSRKIRKCDGRHYAIEYGSYSTESFWEETNKACEVFCTHIYAPRVAVSDPEYLIRCKLLQTGQSVFLHPVSLHGNVMPVCFIRCKLAWNITQVVKAYCTSWNPVSYLHKNFWKFCSELTTLLFSNNICGLITGSLRRTVFAHWNLICGFWYLWFKFDLQS